MDTGITMLDIEQLVTYPDEKLRFRPLDEEHYLRLKDSISQNGIMEPLIVVPSEDKYMILSGHNRYNIACELGIKLPCIIKDNLSEKEQKLIVIDTNLLNRNLDEMLISELSYALSTKYALLKHQGKAQKDNEGNAENSASKVGGEYKLSPAMVKRYIQLTHLTEDIMNLADEHKLPFMAAYNLSFLSKKNQEKLYKYLVKNNLKCAIRHSELLKEEGDCSEEKLDEIFQNTENNIRTRLNKGDFRKYIPSEYREKDMKEVIIIALKAYFGEIEE